MSKRHQTQHLLTNRGSWVLVVVSLFIIGAIVMNAYHVDEDPTEVEWDTYTSEEFDFSIEYPVSWTVEMRTEPHTAVHFYPGNLTSRELPFDHHKPITNVSIFPHGVPTEGMIGVSKNSSLIFQPIIRQSRDYLLQSGDRWATIATFDDVPDTWDQFGYIWSRVALQDEVTTCLRDGRPISARTCDPLTGDTVLRSGTFDPHEQYIVEYMLESFLFTDGVEELADPELEEIPPPDEEQLTEEEPVEETPTPRAECRPTGCSNHICADEEIATTCEWIEAYSCYETARCERQPDGFCGWTPTDDLLMCLQETTAQTQ